MERFLPLPLPWHSVEIPDQSQSHSSNPTLTPQSSLHSIPSLTHNSQFADESATTSAAQFRCLATLKGHSAYIFSLALSGKHLYSGASDGEIRVWGRNPNSADYNYTVAEGYSAVKSIVIAGDKLITAHHDHKIRVWKIDNNSAPYQKYKMIATLPTLNDRCLRIFSTKNYVQIRRHNKRTWVHHVDTVSCLAVSNDGHLLYSVSWDRTLKVWRTSDFKCVESVQNAHDDAINAVVLSADGGCVYTGSADKTIKLWRRRDGDKKLSLVSTLEKHKSAVNALALSGDGAVLYSGACDRSIIVWENVGGGAAANWVAAGALRGHKMAILCLAVVEDLVCSGSADRTVRIWRRGSGRRYGCAAVLEGHRSPVKCLTVDNVKRRNSEGRNSYMVYSGSLDFDVRVWQIGVPF